MKRNKENSLSLNENKHHSSIASDEQTSFKRVTRNSLNVIDNTFKKSTTRKKTKTKTSTNDIKKKYTPISKCPYVNYLGEIKYFSNFEDISKTSSHLYDIIESSNTNSEIIPISFDMEWPFNFKSGPGRTSVLQLALSENTCYVFSVGEIQKLPYELVKLLEHPKVILYGVNIKNDLRKLERDFSNQINSNTLVDKCLDLGMMYNEIRNSLGRWSLEKLVNKLCRLQIDKSMKIRMSKWNVIPLEEDQLKYSANDVYIGHVIYEKLLSIKKEKADKRKQ